MCWFQTDTVRTGGFAGKANREADSTVLSGPQPEPAGLFIHAAVCLLKAKGQLSSSPKRNPKKRPACVDTNKMRSVTKWTLLKLKVTNTVLFTCAGPGCGVSLVTLTHETHRTELQKEPLWRGSDFRCHGSRQCVVTQLSNTKGHFFSATFRLAAHRRRL